VANYPTQNPSFTTKQDGVDYPQATHINALQDEVVAIGTALRGTLQHNLTLAAGKSLTTPGANITSTDGNASLNITSQATSGLATIELVPNVGGSAYIDLSESGQDYRCRISRDGAANSAVNFVQTGTGGFTFTDGSLWVNSGSQGYIDLNEQSPAPSAPAANRARIYARDNGSGKTQLVVLFPTGAAQVLATEP
jgi:hypothetical protein